MAVRVKHNAARVRSFGAVVLYPGTNRLNDADYEAVKGRKLWQERVKSGVIVVLDSAPVADVTVEQGGKPALSAADQLIEEINDCYNVDRLNELADHKTKKVRDAAKARLEEVGPTEVKEGE